MNTLLFLLLASSPAAMQSEHALASLAGCWAGRGEVMGKATENLARGSWKLGQRYLLLELHSTDQKDTEDRYDAAILIAPRKDGKLLSFWMDSFGGEYSASGTGLVDPANMLTINYPYPDATFVNRLTRTGEQWNWEIDRLKPGAAPKRFASYSLSRAPCRSDVFSFSQDQQQ